MCVCYFSSNDEDEGILVKKSRVKNKKSNEVEEDPGRLARTIFVGNLPVAFTRKVSKHISIFRQCVLKKTFVD